MAMNIATNRMFHFALRALQLTFAIIIMGADGYAIHIFKGHTVYEHFEFGNFYDYMGVPDAWGFLMFCAGWTILDVIFVCIAGIGHTLIGYISIAAEVVSVLSWLAGWIAMAVNIGSNQCPEEEHGCGALEVATTFGALEFLLFVITTALTVQLIFKNTRRQESSTISSTLSK
ncbi:marvel domain-containing protein [Penicillium verhagenii]|uniref:marvel domain-containing protein n=1 Tax=Penicillium verhagenii TaxID=1562060 RepID=UPI002545205D|nr:marvel domain-containing protein [Penicillium verhagenii]KAJ5936595.1 marvel domain-containing protein [Penicillium verhagenii]